MLGLGALWCLILIAFLVTLEYVKQSIQQAAEVGAMPESELRRELAVENGKDALLLPATAAGAGAAAGAAAAPTAVLERTDAEEDEPRDDTVVLEELFGPDHDDGDPDARVRPEIVDEPETVEEPDGPSESSAPSSPTAPIGEDEQDLGAPDGGGDPLEDTRETEDQPATRDNDTQEGQERK